MPKDWVDVRGRWKNKDGSRGGDRYADPEMQALVAQVVADVHFFNLAVPWEGADEKI